MICRKHVPIDTRSPKGQTSRVSALNQYEPISVKYHGQSQHLQQTSDTKYQPKEVVQIQPAREREAEEKANDIDLYYVPPKRCKSGVPTQEGALVEIPQHSKQEDEDFEAQNNKNNKGNNKTNVLEKRGKLDKETYRTEYPVWNAFSYVIIIV